jgi:integrase
VPKARPHPDHPGQGRQRPRRRLPARVQGNSRPAHRHPAPGWRGIRIRVELEEALQRPRRPQGPRRYTRAAGIPASISPHTLRRFLFTWLKTQGIDGALIQLYSGHATRQALEIYSRLTLADAQKRSYDAIGDFAA